MKTKSLPLSLPLIAFVLPLSFLLSSCATTDTNKEQRPPTRVEEVIKERKVIVDTACDWVRPVYVHSLDQLTPGTARQILAHNETWEKVCQKDKL